MIICYPRMVVDDAEKEVNQLSDEAMCLDTTQVCPVFVSLGKNKPLHGCVFLCNIH